MPVTSGVLRTDKGKYPRTKLVSGSPPSINISSLSRETHDAFVALATARGLSKGGLAKLLVEAVAAAPEKIASLITENEDAAQG